MFLLAIILLISMAANCSLFWCSFVRLQCSKALLRTFLDETLFLKRVPECQEITNSHGFNIKAFLHSYKNLRVSSLTFKISMNLKILTDFTLF